MFNLLRKTLYDKRSFIIGWGLGLAFLAFLMVLFYPAFSNDNGLDKLMASLPTELKSLKGLIGNLEDLKNLPGYLGGQLFDIRIPMFISVSSIILAVGLTVSEEEKGYVQTLLALPAGRIKVLIAKFLSIVLINLAIILTMVVGIYLGLAFINESINWIVLTKLCSMTLLLCICMTTIVFGIGLATGRRGITMGLGVIIAAGSFIVTTFAKSVEWLQPYEKISLFHYFPASEVAKGNISLINIIVLSGITLIALIIGLIFFRRRDIR